MVQPRVRDLFAAYYPRYAGEEAVFQRHIAAAVRSRCRILDAGCGSGALAEHDLRSPGRLVIGVDVDEGVARNTTIDRAIRGRLDALPLCSDSVDVVISKYVLEHLDNPGQTFTEFARVLRPGGLVVLLTPNMFHYVTLISRITPFWVHRLAKRGHGVDAEDVFPTRYRANSYTAITRLARASGLRPIRLELVESSPNYLEFSRLLYRLGILYQRVVSRFDSLAGLRVNIVATLVKGDAGADGSGMPARR